MCSYTNPEIAQQYQARSKILKRRVGYELSHYTTRVKALQKIHCYTREAHLGGIDTLRNTLLLENLYQSFSRRRCPQ